MEAINVLLETDKTKLRHYGLFQEPNITRLAEGLNEARGLGQQGLLARNLSIILEAKTERFIVKDLNGQELRQVLAKQRLLEQQRVRQKRYREKQKRLNQERLWREIESSRRKDEGIVLRGSSEYKVLDNPLLKALAAKFAPKREVMELEEKVLLKHFENAKRVLLSYANSGAVFSFKQVCEKNVLLSGKDNVVLFLIALLFLAQEGFLLFDQEGEDVKISKV